MNKKILLYAITPALVLTIAGSALTVSAATTDNVRPNPMGSFVSAIAKKFNLKTEDVQKVIDEQRTQHHADRMASAVSSGKITQAQANLISAKKVELDAFRASLEGKTQAEKITAMKAQAEVLKKWASDNGIPSGIAFLGGPGLGHGMGKGQGRGGMMK